MAAGTFTGSLASPYRLDKIDQSENQVAKKSSVPLLLVGALDTANTGITTSYQQISSTFDIGNAPCVAIKGLWTYGAAAVLLSVRLKASMDNGVLDAYEYVEDIGTPTLGVYVVSIAELTYSKTTWDAGGGVARFPISWKEPRRRFFQVWAKADSATTNTLSGYVGAGSRGSE